MMSNEHLTSEGARNAEPTEVNAEPTEVNAEPTMINVRSEGLKLDLVLLNNKVTGLTIDFQNSAKSDELHRWLRVIDGMLSGSALSSERSIPQILGEAARLPV